MRATPTARATPWTRGPSAGARQGLRGRETEPPWSRDRGRIGRFGRASRWNGVEKAVRAGVRDRDDAARFPPRQCRSGAGSPPEKQAGPAASCRTGRQPADGPVGYAHGDRDGP
ncbi:hypothetical protein E3E14_18955 [Streptomyces sp. ICN441]|nr:hypothetical protein E3E14_18955 [Streptomyces sp. ICN441]